MKRRTVIAFRLGYLLGARAGPHHYEELRRLASSVVKSGPFQWLLSKAAQLLGTLAASLTGQTPGWSRTTAEG